MAKDIKISGFCGELQLSPRKKNEEKSSETLLCFDSGRSVTFADAAHHAIVMGTTGSGKTASVIYPCLGRLIQIGASGLVIDVKGSLRRQTAALAKASARENDIIELGTSASAEKLNILKGLEVHGLRRFFEAVVMSYSGGEHTNSDWTRRGIAQTSDCALLLQLLSKKYSEFEPTVRLVLDMIESPAEAANLFKFFKKNVYDHANDSHRRFVSAVENNEFHTLKAQTKDEGFSRTTSGEQQTWNLNMARDALRDFLASPGLEANFCNQGSPGLDLSPYLAANKIVALRFELNTGPLGSKLARMVISHFYQLIFELGQRQPQNRKFFICIDEFQEVADLSDGRFSDTSFIAQAREFNCAFIAATQSMSALVCKGEKATAVEAFVSNCNQRVLFYSDDPVTQEMAKRYDPAINLAELESGEAFVVTYSQDTRRHEHGVETLEESFQSTQELIEGQTLDIRVPLPEEQPAGRSLFSLSDLARELDTKKAGRSRKGRRAMKNRPESIYEEFTEYFDPEIDPSAFNLPPGWIPRARSAFKAFSTTGMCLTITAFRFYNGSLTVETPDRGMHGHASELAREILNSLFREMGYVKYCAICGELIDTKKKEKEDDEEEINRPRRGSSQPYMCESCLKRLLVENRPQSKGGN